MRWTEICNAKEEHRDLASNSQLVDVVIEESQDSSSLLDNDSIYTTSSTLSQTNSIFSNMTTSSQLFTSTPNILSIMDKKLIFDNADFGENKENNLSPSNNSGDLQLSEDELLFSDYKFINMLNQIEQKAEIQIVEENISSPSNIECFQKKRKISAIFDQEEDDYDKLDSLEHLLSNKRFLPIENTQEQMFDCNELKEPYLSLY